MAANMKYYQDQFEKLVNRPGPINDALTAMEKKTQVKRTYIAYGIKYCISVNPIDILSFYILTYSNFMILINRMYLSFVTFNRPWI